MLPDGNLTYIPKQGVLSALQCGWRLIPDQDYTPGEYAVLMALRDIPEPLTPSQMRLIAAKFDRPLVVLNNKSAGATSRHVTLNRARMLAELNGFGKRESA